MVIVRFLVLLFLASYGIAMGNQGQLNGFGNLVALSALFTVPALYLLPTYEAWNRKHENLMALGLLNLFLGWTFIGWVGAMVWAFKKPSTVVTSNATADLAPTERNENNQKETKICPFCGEEILAVAIKCKHCGSNVG
jgi:hypothetical protein